MKRIQNAFEPVVFDNETKEKLLCQILESKPQRKKSPFTRTFAAAACCAAVLLSVYLVPSIWDIASSPGGNIDNPGIVLTPVSPPLAVGSPPLSHDFLPPKELELTGLAAGQHVPAVALGSYGVLNFHGDIDLLEPARLFIDPEATYRETWGWEKAIGYLGADFCPGWLPEGLRGQNTTDDLSWEVILNNDGTPFLVDFTLHYSEVFDDEYDPLRRCVFITAAKNAVPFRCYLISTDKIPSMIHGVEVTAGHKKMPYGPFTVTPPGQANTPAGYYDLYIAEFVVDGIGYSIRSNNLTQEEFIHVLCSVLW
jgi:hypothetical protein